MKIRRIAKGVVGTTVLFGLLFWSYTRDAASDSTGFSDTAQKEARLVQVERVSRLNEGPTVRLSAVTRASAHSRIAFALGGRILKRPVEVGDTVQKGDLLAILDAESLRNAVAAQESGLEELEVRLKQAARESVRTASLAQVGAAPSAAEEDAKSSKEALVAAKETAMVRLSEARRQLRESTLRAPFSGVVTAVPAEPGEVVGPGEPVVVLDGAEAVEVELSVPESLTAGLGVGGEIPVDLPLVGIRGLQGTVTQVGRNALGEGGLFPVVISLPVADGVRGGLTAEAVLPAGGVSGLGVPVGAVLNPSGRDAAVLKVVDGKAVRVPVTTYAMVDDWVEIDGDISENDLVIEAGHQQLLGGETVEVLQ